MSAMGQKQTLEHVRVMSALPPKADIDRREQHVRFVPEADTTFPSLWRHEDCREDSVYQHRNGGDRNDVTEQTEHTVKGTEGVEGRLCNA